jgi:PAT family beta-lactamase induction signal transducer AmpG
MTKEKRSGWWWVPSLYYAEGIPYNIAMIVSVVMYKTMGISNTMIAFWTSILYLPWTIKPLWSPFVDVISTKRKWIIWTQFLLAIAFFAVGLTINLPFFFTITLLILWIVAFSSATHDIAADGFYMLALNEHKQAWFVGIRSTFYRFATITAMGLIVMLAGYIESNTGLEPAKIEVQTIAEEKFLQNETDTKSSLSEISNKPNIIITPDRVQIPLYGDTLYRKDSIEISIKLSTSPQPDEEIIVNFGRKSGSKDISLASPGRLSFTEKNWDKPVKAIIKIDPRLKEPASAIFEATAGNTPFSWAVSFSLLGFMLLAFSLYHKYILPHPADTNTEEIKDIFSSYVEVFRSFFRKKGIIAGIFLLLLYRLAESQLVKLASPFLLDSQEVGGLALTTAEVGFVYGTVGIACLLLGGLTGGFVAAANGLKKWIWWMAIGINLPDLVYVYLSYVQPDNFLLINLGVGIEQFGYGFGFTGYMLYMIYLSEGKFKTSHFAITTAFMAIGMMIPGMVSGYIQEWLGYQHFFIWVVVATIPSFIILKFIHLDPEFGKRKD